MDFGRFPARNGRRAAVAALLFVFLVFPGPGCGKREGGGSPAAAPGVSGPPSATPDKAGVRAAVGGRHEVDIDPLIPTRITPPGITVKPSPGHAREVTGIRWYVNGSQAETGPRLSPSRFGRGDRIYAEVTLRVDGTTALAKTREAPAGNSPPALSAVRIEPVNPVSGGIVRASAVGGDADGDALRIRYEWYVDNVLVPGDDEKIALKGVKKGALVHARAVPNDGIEDGAWAESPRYRVVNGLPVVKSQLPKEIPADGNFRYRIEAEDPDGDPLTYDLKKGPPGMVLNGSTLEWQVPKGNLGQSVEVLVEISDGEDSRTVLALSITVQPPK